MGGIAIGLGVWVSGSGKPPGGGGGPSGDALLKEDSGYLLFEDGSYFLLG